jgi:4-hydroxyacetophenone monooxygenase
MQSVAAELGVTPFVQFNTEATQCIWNDAESVWEVTVLDRVTGLEKLVKASFVVNGTGFFSLLQMPKNITGIEKFKGKSTHSAQWDMSIVLEGKKVVLVGNGASGLQIVENITDKVAKLDIFQSNPSWIAPRNAEKLTDRTKWMLKNIPGYAKLMRAWGELSRPTSFYPSSNCSSFQSSSNSTQAAGSSAGWKTQRP